MTSDPTGTPTKAMSFGFSAPIEDALVGEIVEFFRAAGRQTGLLAIAPMALPANWNDLCLTYGLSNGSARAKFACPIDDFIPSTTDLPIRRLTSDNVAGWVRIIREAFSMADPDFAPLLVATIEDPVARILGAFDGDLLVGAGAVHLLGEVAAINTGGTLPTHCCSQLSSPLVLPPPQLPGAGCLRRKPDLQKKARPTAISSERASLTTTTASTGFGRTERQPIVRTDRDGLDCCRPAELQQRGMTLPTLTTRFTEVEYLDEGPSTGTPVVLVHGFPDVPGTWNDVVSLLPPGLRVIRPFLRGVGGSHVVDPEARSGQVAALATDLLDLLDALDLDSVVLAGHDWGARTAHAVAVLAPEKVRGLVTMSTAYGPSSLLSGQDALDELAAAWYRYWLCTASGNTAFRQDPTQLIRWAWKNWSPAWELSQEELTRILQAVDTDDFADHVVHYYRHGAGEAPGSPTYGSTQAVLNGWPSISAPTTFLIGTEDGCETLSLARSNAPYFTGGRELVELDGAGHFIPRENPQAVADAISRHL